MNSETIYHLPRPKRDANGNPLGIPPENPIPGAVVWPRASSELASGEVGIGGENVKIDDNAYNQTLTHRDQLRIRGLVHEIDEPPQRYAGKAIILKTKVVST